MYEIKKYSFDRLEELNNKIKNNKISIEPSKNKNKKIDVFLNGKKINTIGDNRYMDYPSYILKNGIEYADKRRRLYYTRHAKEKDIKDGKITNSWWSKYLLW
jgi:hypothetical protein